MALRKFSRISSVRSVIACTGKAVCHFRGPRSSVCTERAPVNKHFEAASHELCKHSKATSCTIISIFHACAAARGRGQLLLSLHCGFRGLPRFPRLGGMLLYPLHHVTGPSRSVQREATGKASAHRGPSTPRTVLSLPHVFSPQSLKSMCMWPHCVSLS